MACHELFTRARAKIAASRIAIKVSVALGIMSGYALALKGLKRAANVCAPTSLESVVILKLTKLGDLGRKRFQRHWGVPFFACSS